MRKSKALMTHARTTHISCVITSAAAIIVIIYCSLAFLKGIGSKMNLTQ